MGRIVSLSTGLGIILSAEVLRLLGNGVGQAGGWFLICVALAAGVHLLGAVRLFGRLSGPADETALLQRTLGPVAALALPLAARVPVALLAATSLLATAGYVFNEIFVYWFPNFLFAFLLLGLVLGVGLAGGTVWAGFQIITVLAALGGLIFLIGAGLATSPAAPAPQGPELSEGQGFKGALGAVLLVLTYDLAFLAKDRRTAPDRQSPALAVALGSAILMSWGLISLRWVAPDTLAGSTIPYTVTARTIMGQEGRIIMGVVLVAGTAAAVNALFGGIARMAAGMAAAGLLPAGPLSPVGRQRRWTLLMAGATAALLMAGMAGSPHLELFLRAGLILWLLHHALMHLAALRTVPGRHTLRNVYAAHMVGGLLLILATGGLLVTRAEAAAALLFMAGVWAASAIAGWVLYTLARQQNARRQKQHTANERSRR